MPNRKAEARKASRFAEPVQEGGGLGSGEDVEGRQKWFYYKRAYPFDEIPANARRLAWESRPIGDKGRVRPLSQQLVWSPIGPAPTMSHFWGLVSGRINAVAVSPANPQLILVGASTGGIWRSIDGGANFAPVSDAQVDLAVGSIAFAPSDPSVVYAGMGDIDNAYLGTGVLRSNDAGATWTRVNNSTLPAPGTVAEIKVDPANPNRVYLAQYTANLDNELLTRNILNASGLFISTDGGINWRKTLGGLVRDVVIHPSNAQTLYAGTRRVEPTDPLRPPGVYKSTDGGETWTNIYATPFSSLQLLAARDVRLAVTPAAPQRLYVYVGNTGPNVVRVEVSDDGGLTWRNRGATGLDPGQFGYNTYIYADPVNPDTVYVGARDVYKSTDAGAVTLAPATWTNLTKNFVSRINPTTGVETFPYQPDGSLAHPDQQSFAFSPANSNVIYAGNDGGLYKSENGGASFQSLNSTLSLSQFIGVTQHPTDPNISYGGTQDNGTQRRGVGTNQWTEFAGGDGGRVVVNPLDPQMVFATYVYGTIWRFTANGDLGGTTVGSNARFGEPVSSPRIAFYPPFVGNGVDQKLYFGTWRLFVSTDLGNTWTPPAGVADLTKGPANTTVVPSVPADVLTAIGVSRSNTNFIYTGSARGRAMFSNDGGANWTDITAGLPDRFIECIAVDPASPAVAYLSVSGYGTGHVFKTVNSGATWTDISGNLPNIPTSALLIDPLDSNTLYAGTDIGVFRSTNGGINWENFNNGMPPAVVTSFSAQPDGRIQLSTYGRGAFELKRDIVCTFTLAPVSQSFIHNGGSATLNVSTTNGCNWTATSNADWITITSGSPASGSGTLHYSVAANNTNAVRTGTLTVAGQSFTVTQNSAALSPSVQFSSASYNASEGDKSIQVTLTRAGDPASAFSVSYETVNQTASDRSDYMAATGTLNFVSGEASKTLTIFITDDLFKETPETLTLALSSPLGATLGTNATATLAISDNDAADAVSPVRDPNFDSTFFVRQHYLDFFNREPDAAGLAFWKNQIDECTTQECREIRRINVSAAFFISIEFQETGYLVYRFYQSAFNTAERLPMRSFLTDTQEIGRGVVIGQPGASALLEANTQAYAARFVARPQFLAQYPLSMSAFAFIDALNANTGNALSSAERTDLIAKLGTGQIDRAQALRAVSENSAFRQAHYSRAFVLMQYFGYLRRNPNDPPQEGLDYSGYNFWLGKLNSFGGNPITSEMVKAFITSGEYQQRFGL